MNTRKVYLLPRKQIYHKKIILNTVGQICFQFTAFLEKMVMYRNSPHWHTVFPFTHNRLGIVTNTAFYAQTVIWIAIQNIHPPPERIFQICHDLPYQYMEPQPD
jgi:hypothetical protein